MSMFSSHSFGVGFLYRGYKLVLVIVKCHWHTWLRLNTLSKTHYGYMSIFMLLTHFEGTFLRDFKTHHPLFRVSLSTVGTIDQPASDYL